MKTAKKHCGADFKAKIMEIRDEPVLAEPAAKHGIHGEMIASGTGQAIKMMSPNFAGTSEAIRADNDRGPWTDNMSVKRLGA